MKTAFTRKEDMSNGKYPRQWWVVDAEGMTLGRLSSRIANVLRGKHKVIFSPHVDTGDYVIVVNAEKVKLTGNKNENKNYYYHTGFPGGLKTTKASELRERQPTTLIHNAVKGMMAKNSLNRHTLERLKIYTGQEHPHVAQNPQPLEI